MVFHQDGCVVTIVTGKRMLINVVIGWRMKDMSKKTSAGGTLMGLVSEWI
jgi:hypothetical protein